MDDRIEVTLKSRKVSKQVPISKAHYWYDPYLKETWSDVGGRLTFVYDRDEQRMKPVVVEAFTTTRVSNFNDLVSWAEDNERRFGFDVVEQGEGYFITLSVPKEQMDDVIESLTLNRITFEY